MTWWRTILEVGPLAVAVRGFRELEMRSGLLPILSPAHYYDTDFEHPGASLFADRIRYTLQPSETANSLKHFYELRPIERDLSIAFSEMINVGEVRWFDRTTVCEMPPDWHSIEGTQWERAHYSDVSKHPTGDLRSAWELGRFGFVFDLVRAFVIDSDPRWCDLFCDIVRSFARDNPVNEGVHWTNGQEVALRALNIFIGLSFFRDQLESGTYEELCDVLYWHGRYVHFHFEFATDVLQNNHLISEALALMVLSRHFREWPEAAEWEEDAREGLVIARGQFFDDGGYCQASHNYHRFAIQLLLWGEKLGCDVSAFEHAFLRTEQVWSSQMIADGTLSNFGQNDGAWFGPRTIDSLCDFRGTLNALRFRNRGSLCNDDLRYSVWLFADRISYAAIETPTIENVGTFPRAGLTYRRVREDGEHLATVRTGVGSVRSGHADVGHVDLTLAGRRVAIDSGSERYLPGRDPLMDEEHHNLVTCAGHRLREPIGHFGWQATSYDITHSVDDEVITVSHSAFLGWTYSREVTWRDGWKVVDRLQPDVLEEPREFVVRWKIPSETGELAQRGATYRVDLPTYRVTIDIAGVVEPTVSLEESYYAPTYRCREPALLLSVKMNTRDGFVVTTYFSAVEDNP